MTTVLFPGQGIQTTGMGGRLFDLYSDYLPIADQVLGYSIKEICLDPQYKKHLQQSIYAQPAVFTVNAFSYYAYLIFDRVRHNSWK